MVVGIREMVQGLFRFWDEHISADGAWWILVLDSVLLIPLIFAMFFYPVTVLMGVGVAAVLTLAAIALKRAIDVHHPRQRAVPVDDDRDRRGRDLLHSGLGTKDEEPPAVPNE